MASMADAPSLALPATIFGTMEVDDPEAMRAACAVAIEVGFRHFDMAERSGGIPIS